MRIPAFLHGAYRDVDRAASRLLTALGRGSSLDDAVDGWIELPPASGWIVLQGPSPLLRGDHVHAFCPSRAFDRRWEELAALRARWFDLAIARPWSALALLGQDAHAFVTDEDLLTFLEHLSGYWPELEAVGERYSTGLDRGEALWALPSKIKYALARQGLDDERLRGPVGPGGLAALMRATPGWQIREHLRDGQIDAAVARLRGFDEIPLVAMAMHFVASGHGERAAEVVRDVAAVKDLHGHLGRWLARHAPSSHQGPSLESARAAFLASGSPESWQRLAACDAAEAERALDVVRARRRADLVLQVRLWDRDAGRVLAAWDDAVAQGHDPWHVAADVALLVASVDPGRAAQLFLISADALAVLPGAQPRWQAAQQVRRAHATLTAAGRADDAARLVAEFRRTHARRRALLAALDDAGV